MNRIRALLTRLTRRDTLTCREMVELVTDYVEGMMPARERRRVDAHLARCVGCRSIVEQIRVTVLLAGRVTEADVMELPPETLQPLMAAFRAARHPPAPER